MSHDLCGARRSYVKTPPPTLLLAPNVERVTDEV
jgi:hypothetical protein